MPAKLVETACWPAPNKPGKMLMYFEHLKKEGVDLDAFWAYSTAMGESRMAAVGKNPAKLRAALKKAGVDFETSRCFLLTGTDKAGALIDATQALAKAGVNIEAADAVAAAGRFAATIFVRENELNKAKKALKAR